MNNSVIFTEIFNCGEVGKISLESFFRFHDRKVYVFGAKEDFEVCLKHENIIPIVYDDLQDKFQKGHLGTAFIFATAYTRWKGQNVIRFDSDVIFKQQAISFMEEAFEEGFDIIGSRRCYKNNPVNIPIPDNIPDTLSTYFLGINTKRIPTYDFDTFCKMWQGAYHPWNWPILDFGDAVIHSIMNNGGKINYMNPNLIGGQDEDGKKFNAFSCYRSNLHLDMGTLLAHFGGVGSGCAVYNGKFSPEKSYADWALLRYALWSKLFSHVEIIADNEPPVFDIDQRWISGGYSTDLLNLIKHDLQN